MTRIFPVITLLLLFSIAGYSKPTRPAPPPKPLTPKQVAISKLKALEGPISFGYLELKGDEVTISGHQLWEAGGWINDNGEIVLIWINNDTGVFYPGLYKVDTDDEGLVGKYGDSSVATVVNRTVVGATTMEFIRRRIVVPDI